MVPVAFYYSPETASFRGQDWYSYNGFHTYMTLSFRTSGGTSRWVMEAWE